MGVHQCEFAEIGYCSEFCKFRKFHNKIGIIRTQYIGVYIWEGREE